MLATLRERWWRVAGAGTARALDTHVTAANAPTRPGIDAQTPTSMPRAEDDDDTRAHSPEFHDRPGSGKHTADKHTFF